MGRRGTVRGRQRIIVAAKPDLAPNCGELNTSAAMDRAAFAGRQSDRFEAVPKPNAMTALILVERSSDPDRTRGQRQEPMTSMRRTARL